MPCESCHTKDEQVRELEARVRYLESKLFDHIPPINVTKSPNILDTLVNFNPTKELGLSW